VSWYSILADGVMLVHFAYVGFVVVGLALVWLGYFCRWRWVRGFWFRLTHVLAMAVVVVESLCGIVCPLTVWEAELRDRAGQQSHSGSFLQEWVHRVLFFELEESTFVWIYIVFFALLVLSFLVVRPRWPGRFSSCRGET